MVYKSKNLMFEQGPIRPPNEAKSLLLRVTRNCPWNQCKFCRTYKKRKFSLRTLEETKQDIQTVRDIADDINSLSWKIGEGGDINDSVISTVFGNAEYSECYRSVAAWLYYGTGACFLQDADNLIIKTEDMVSTLEFLRKKIPEITRVTTYSRSKTVARKSLESLKQIHNAGLNRIHMGLESGSDRVLKFIKKGVTSAQHVEAGCKAKKAGLEVSEYVMPGLGGQEMWRQHAIESAKVLNQIDPHFIRLRSLRVLKILPLYQEMLKNKFKMQTDDMLVEEIKLFVENLNGISSTVTSDHITNLLEEVAGSLPYDKQKMLTTITKYQELSEPDRLIFRTGRRGGAYSSLDDMKYNRDVYYKISNLVNDIVSEDGIQGLEKFITDMADRSI